MRFLLLVVNRHVCFELLSRWERIKGPNVSSNNPGEHEVPEQGSFKKSWLILLGLCYEFWNENWNDRKKERQGKVIMCLYKNKNEIVDDLGGTNGFKNVTLFGKSRLNENSVVAFFHCIAFSTRWKCVEEHFHCILKRLQCFSTEPRCMQIHFKIISKHCQCIFKHWQRV